MMNSLSKDEKANMDKEVKGGKGGVDGGKRTGKPGQLRFAFSLRELGDLS